LKSSLDTVTIHATAPSVEATDWPQIVRLYDDLLGLAPSPVVQLNRAVAVAMADGPAAGLALVDELAASGELPGYHLLPTTPIWTRGSTRSNPEDSLAGMSNTAVARSSVGKPSQQNGVVLMWPAISNPVDHPNRVYLERMARLEVPDRPARPLRLIRPSFEDVRTMATSLQILARRSFASPAASPSQGPRGLHHEHARR
jgi:hypothetical protein